MNIEELELSLPAACATLRQRRSSDEIVGFVFDFAKRFGAINLCYAHAPPVGASDFCRPAIIDSRGLPDGWPETYLQKRYFDCDPISRRALSEIYPFYWRDVSNMIDVSVREQEYLVHMKDEQIDNGLCIPTFGPRGRGGFFGIGMAARAGKFEKDVEFALQSVCQFAHQAICSEIPGPDEKEIGLSARERDVLRSILRGRSNKEIAQRLDISVNSVSTYLDRAQIKLGTNSRINTALQALIAGCLD